MSNSGYHSGYNSGRINEDTTLDSEYINDENRYRVSHGMEPRYYQSVTLGDSYYELVHNMPNVPTPIEISHWYIKDLPTTSKNIEEARRNALLEEDDSWDDEETYDEKNNRMIIDINSNIEVIHNHLSTEKIDQKINNKKQTKNKQKQKREMSQSNMKLRSSKRVLRSRK
jgi:hypothetical protein